MRRAVGERLDRAGSWAWDFSGRHPILAGGIACGVLAAVSRPASFRTPIERDTGQYLYIGGLILDGGTPYVDAANNKGPATFLLFALIKLVSGTSVVAVRLTLLVFAVVAALALAAYVTHLAGRSAGALAGAILAVLGSTTNLQGDEPNTEEYGVAFMLGSLWLATRGGRLAAAGAGALTAITVMMNAGFIAVAPFVLFELWRSGARGKRVGVMVTAGAGAMAAVLPVFLWLAAAGALDSLREQVFVQAVDAVSGDVPQHLRTVLVTDHFDPWSLFDIPAGALFIGGLIGCAAAMRDQRLRPAAIWAAVWIIVMLARAKLPDYTYVHHFYPAMPGIAAGFALGIVSLRSPAHFQRAATVALVLAVPVWAFVVGPQWRALDLAPSERRGHDSPFSLAYPVADFIRAHTTSDERILISEAEPEVYWLSDRRASTRFFDIFSVSWRPEYLPERREALLSTPPAAVGALPGGYPDIDLRWVLTRFHYRLAFEQNGAQVWLKPR